MHTVVPYAVSNPKTRLSPVLDRDERRAFSRVMLDDVLSALRAVGQHPVVLATEPFDCDGTVTVDARPLDAAVNDVLATTNGPVAVVMADLALATPDALDRLFGAGGDVVLAPGRGGGTNAFVSRHPDFHVDYHDASIRDHRRIASSVADDVAEVDSFRLYADVDEPEDLADVLLYGEGGATQWLVDNEFGIVSNDGRVAVTR